MTLSVTITLAALFLLLPPLFANDFSAGPLFDQFPLTLPPGQRTEILGPFFYRETNDTTETWALPPFFSRQTDPGIGVAEDDFLYPVFTYVKYGTQYRGQFIELFSWSGGENPDNHTAHRVTIFPVYFQQRSSGSNDYTAVFPLYGHLRNTLFRDRIFFVMFPACSQTQKRDVINNNYLYPFFNTRHGNGLRGWQFWPFYGREKKVLTTTTNEWGTVETNGGHDQVFVLWPVHFSQDNGIGTDNPEKFRANLPLYAWSRSPRRDYTSVLWPLFNWIDDRERKYREWEMPWPVIVVARGKGKTATRVFPFFSRAYNDTYRDDFYCWPVYKFNSVYAPPLDRRRLRILFFLYQNTAEKNTETGKTERRVDLWPLLVYHRDFDGSSRLQILALLETFMSDNSGIERNWSPLWSLWRYEKKPAAGANSQSLLWNFYRRDASPAAKKISFCFGLYQYQSSPGKEKLRLFYVPLINRR